MVKLIRTAQIKGPAVTVGELERDSYVGSPDGSSEEGVDALELDAFFVEEVRKRKETVDSIWQEKLDREIKAVRSGLEDRNLENEEKWKQEKEKLHDLRFEEGLSEGLAQREAEAKSAIDYFGQLRESLMKERREILINTETTVIDLTIAIVRRLIAIEVKENKKVLVNTVKAALGELSQYGNIVIRVNPEDLALASRFSQHWVDKVDKDLVMKVQSCDHVDRGGCFVEGPVENIDARLEKQLDLLLDALKESVIQEIDDVMEEKEESIDE